MINDRIHRIQFNPDHLGISPMCDDFYDAKPTVSNRQAAKDKQEIAELKEHYGQWMGWKDQGILHDLREKHHRDNPSRLLLLSIAMGVAQQDGLKLGRQEKRRRDLLIGWINKHYAHFRDIIHQLVLGDSTGELSGAVSELAAYRRARPDDQDVEAMVKDSDFKRTK
jgi:hypothetical protein